MWAHSGRSTGPARAPTTGSTPAWEGMGCWPQLSSLAVLTHGNDRGEPLCALCELAKVQGKDAELTRLGEAVGF